MKQFYLVALFPALCLGGQHAGAKSKVWDQAEYAKCVSRTDEQMDPSEVISSRTCKQFDAAEHTTGDLNDVSLDRFVAGIRKKTPGQAWVNSITLIVDYHRMQTALGGNSVSGYTNFDRATMLVGDQLRELHAVPFQRQIIGCSTGGRGLLSYSQCHYAEAVSLLVDDEMLAAFRAAAEHDPAGRVHFKLFGSDSSFEFDVNAGEVLAVQAAESDANT